MKRRDYLGGINILSTRKKKKKKKKETSKDGIRLSRAATTPTTTTMVDDFLIELSASAPEADPDKCAHSSSSRLYLGQSEHAARRRGITVPRARIYGSHSPRPAPAAFRRSSAGGVVRAAAPQ